MIVFGKDSMRSLVVFISLLILTATVSAQSLTVMSYNIRLDLSSDGVNAWPNRASMLTDLIRYNAPDIVGLQEAQRHQLDAIAALLPEYAWLGVGRDDGKDAGEFMAILYRKDAVEVLQNATYWCSPSPEKPGLGWDAGCNRVVTWGKFRTRKERKEFYFYNTHLDHLGITARRESAKLLMDSVNARTGTLPVIITGDFNSGPADAPYAAIIAGNNRRTMKDAYTISERPPYGPRGTFNGFNISEYAKEPIDYIFVSNGITVRSHAVLTDSYHGRVPSDHFPLVSVVRLPARP